MSGADFLDDEALQAPREDRDERDRNEGDEVLFRALDDGIQPPVAAEPGERALNHPADAGRNELSVSAARDGLDGDAECLTSQASLCGRSTVRKWIRRSLPPMTATASPKSACPCPGGCTKGTNISRPPSRRART